MRSDDRSGWDEAPLWQRERNLRMRPHTDRAARREPITSASARPRLRGGKLVLLGSIIVAAGFAAACGDRPDEAAPARPPSPSEPATPDAAELPPSPENVSPSARIDTWQMLREDLASERHASDGGGRAWIVGHEGRPTFPASSSQRIEMIYEAGPHGIAEGGSLFLLASPFWDWDAPQSSWPDGPGYTEVDTEADGVTLEVFDGASQMLVIGIGGRALRAGEQVHLVFGAGRAMARVDRYAERETPIYFAVDGDGDGVRAVVADSPIVDILAREPARLQLTLPTTARPGQKVRLILATLDGPGNLSASDGVLVFEDVPEGLGLPERVTLSPADGGRLALELQPTTAGVIRLRAHGEGPLEGIAAESNPMLVREDAPRVLWADLHGHSQLSDGTGTPEDYYVYAREVAGLDVAALTDHDHWGMRFLDATPAMWDRIREAAKRHNEPGRFVSLLGYEWTSWLHGHRHVLYFEDEGEVLSSLDERYESPDGLWAALEGKPALTFAHHSAGGPIATNWGYPPHPVLEPVTEIVSVHGSSEALDSPGPIYSPVPGNFVRDAVGAGYRLGFIGSGDSHDGHPGLVQLANHSPQGGLAAIFSESVSRESVLEALRERRVYATNGARILLRVELDGAPMGSLVAATVDPLSGEAPAPQRLFVEVVAPSAIERVDFIRSGRQAGVPGEGARMLEIEREIPPLLAGEFHYVRVVLEDGGAAWSSPIYAR